MADVLPKLSDAALGFLTFNTVLAFYRTRSDPWTASFVVLAYVNLLLLFYCLRALEKTPRRNQREKLKLAVLVLATSLNFTFTYQVSKLMPPALKVFVWCLAGSLTGGGFYAFYFLPQ